MITVKKSIKFSSDTCCLHHLIGTDRHVTIRSFSRGWLYAKTTFQFQSEENGINYTKKMANSFLKTTHSKRVTHASSPTFLSSCKFDLNFKGWRNHESGNIFVEFDGSGSFVFLQFSSYVGQSYSLDFFIELDLKVSIFFRAKKISIEVSICLCFINYIWTESERLALELKTRYPDEKRLSRLHAKSLLPFIAPPL